MQRYTRPGHYSTFVLLLAAAFAVMFSSCQQPDRAMNYELNQKLQAADSLATMDKIDSARKLAAGVRPSLKPSDPALCSYYCFMANWRHNPDTINLYADSALAFFNTEGRKLNYPNHYYKALLAKGDACIALNQYYAALKYYYNAKKILNLGNCEDGYLSTKMAGIYYSQKNYLQAGRFWAQSAGMLAQCSEVASVNRQFYMQQSALNNAGISYQKSGKLDSALYYYLKDVKLIEQAQQHGVNTHAASIVVYDNLGGLSLKQHDYNTAEKYLQQSLAIPLTEVNGIKIPPLLKLSDLYIQTRQYNKAEETFSQSKARLNRFKAENPDLEMAWNQLYARYCFALGQAAKAYNYQNTYIRIKDSIERKSVDLYKVDVSRELNSLYQQQALTDLAQKNKTKKIYLASIIIIALLSFVIIFLIYRNLKRSQNIQKSTIIHNQQLQQALAELERVNQNYIRIMRVMAHDLRNPLSGMTGLAALLLGEDEFTDEHKHMLQLIETTGIHSMEMINELLKSGLADEKEVMEVQPLDLKSLLYDSVELLQFKASEKHQRIVFSSDDMPVVAAVNHEKIWRVFNNLIVNAIKFSHENGIIQVGISHDEHSILVSVADSGIGIPDKDKEIIFEMFTTAKKVGTGGEQPFGLGLSISKRIIEKHKGKIWFDSTPGTGTTFYIQLPYNPQLILTAI